MPLFPKHATNTRLLHTANACYPRFHTPVSFRLLALASSSQRHAAAPPPRASAPEPEKRVFVLPLDYYSVLKARRINSAEILRRNYENAVGSPPGVGYSETSLRSRAMILKLAADCLLESEQRREYDASIAQGSAPGIEVRLADIPGALVLLQESGEMEKVLEYGTHWLNSNADHPASRDVALTMALAYCDLASDTLAKNEGGVASCCEELETAIELLAHFKVAPNLQEEIKGTLKELRPQYILEQFALPEDGTNAAKKTKAMKQLKALVWEMDDELNLSPFLDDRQTFLQQARDNLTAAQQIELYEHAPKDVAIPIMEVYDTALAYVAAGYREKWPQHIYQASSALQKIQVASMSGSDPDAMDVTVELGLCALLLGESNKALNFLGLAPNANKLPNEEVLAYVQENSPSTDDLLPGVCALAERWLKETIIPNYKEMSISQTSLGEWFQSKKVSVYLQVLERGKELNLLSAASATMKLSSSVAKGISTAVSKSFSGIKGIIKRPSPATKNDPIFKAEPGETKLPNLMIPSAPIEDTIELDDMEELRRLNSLNGSGSTSQNGSAPPVSGKDNGVHSELSKVMEGDMAIGSSWDEEDEKAGSNHAGTMKNPLAAMPVNSISTNGTKAASWESNGNEPHHIGGEVPLERETTGNSGGFFGTALFKAIAAGGVVLAVVAFGTIRANQRLHPITRSNITPLQRLTDSISDIFIDYQGILDVPLAEELLNRWHGIKAEALGATHNTELLADVLEGNMLRQWRDRAQYVKQDGWHWKYKILDLSVDKVSVARDGRKATVEAHIKERAELIDQGRKADWYSTSYSVQYELSMHKQGWKISSSRVVYESK